MNQKNNFGRLLALLIIVLIGCMALYWLPDNLFGYDLKKVDLLADVREKTATISLDSLMRQLEQQADSIHEADMETDSLAEDPLLDPAALALRDSLHQAVYSVAGADSLGTHIEDYSAGHVGLSRFFTALKNRANLNRPVRVAFLGDSFIEGDIIVADVRAALQKQFGGNGVGFVPIFTVTDQYRPTINQKAAGWNAYSILKEKGHPYMLSGMVFEPKEKASLAIKPTKQYTSLGNASSFKFYYRGDNPGTISYVSDNLADTIVETLTPNSSLGVFEIKKSFQEASFFFSGGDDLLAYGTATEDSHGIVVDNFSLRGNLGMVFDQLDVDFCHSFAHARPYDLIILQYGPNVASEDVLDYGWYRARMIKVIKHIQQCFPHADIMLMGVPDRSYQVDNSFETMPAVLALLHAQRQIAKSTGVPFWNTFGAMGGVNSMVRYVENNWASKDYTHLSFRGGREIARALYDALMLEKEFYDEVDKSGH